MKTPLEAALAEVAELQSKLKDEPKTKQTLDGAMGRLKMHQKRNDKVHLKIFALNSKVLARQTPLPVIHEPLPDSQHPNLFPPRHSLWFVPCLL